MSRIRLNPYAISKSAKALSRYLGIKRLKITKSGSRSPGSRFVGKNTDVVINWGNGKGNIGNARQINKLYNVQLAANKLRALEALQASGVSTPTFGIGKEEFSTSELLYGRSELWGHSGKGIYVGTKDEIPDCPLYVQAIEKVAEYRAIVVGDKVVDFKKKKKRNTPEGEEQIQHDEYIWNLSGGYIFARNNFDKPSGADSISISAVEALGLDFGAVDLIEDADGKLYVLEINTAFGLEGTTIELVGDALKELIGGHILTEAPYNNGGV